MEAATITTRICSKCGQEKSDDEFYIRSETGKRYNRCKECWTATRRLLKFGVSDHEYLLRLAVQGGGCAICGDTENFGRPLAVDHDHATGAVRGVLCSRCNVGLGQFRDSSDLLKKAIKYLE